MRTFSETLKKSADLVYLGMHIQENGLAQTFDITILNEIKRLAIKHHRICENQCDKEGWEDKELPIEEKIIALVNKLNGGALRAWTVEYQGDPRGNTVKLYCCERWINLDLF